MKLDHTAPVGERAMRLLESFTPYGSEFHNEPETCARHIQSRLDSQERTLKNLMLRLKKYEKEKQP